jgi:hypothetical protein
LTHRASRLFVGSLPPLLCAVRMFALYASGQHSLNGVRKILKMEFGAMLAKGYLERLLKNPFYKG